MRNLNITICGAQDIKPLISDFNMVVEGFNCIPSDYLSSTTYHSQNANYTQSSERTIKETDIIIICVVDNYGEITWSTEYPLVSLLNKPYVIMIEESIYSAFERERIRPLFREDTPTFKLINEIQSLIGNQKPFVQFNQNTFAKVLRREIGYIFFEAFNVFQEQQKHSLFFEIIRRENLDEIKDFVASENETKILKTTLLSPATPKELRKQILTFFTVHKGLSDENIIMLLNDREQGVYRRAIELLSELLSDESDEDVIFEELILLYRKSHDQVGIINRIIPSICKTNLARGLDYLIMLFPANRINIPRLIIQELINQFENYKSMLGDKEFLEKLDGLALVSKQYSSSLDNDYTILKEKIDTFLHRK